MYRQHSVLIDCNDDILLNEILTCPISNCKSLDSMDDKVSKDSNDLGLNRNKGEHALIKTDNALSNINVQTTSVHSNFKRDKSTIAGSKEKEQLRYIINSIGKNNIAHKVENRIEKLNIEELTSSEMKHDEKATYCRPVINFYNEQFIFKTMERNARLKNLVKKMVMARQREKENVTWNNFINMLKNKHSVSDSNYLGDINDFCDEKWPSNKRSRLCKELLDNFYDHNHLYNKQLGDNTNKNTTNRHNFFKYGEDLLCYPTSSQARIIMLERERRQNQCRNNWGDHASDRNLFNRKRTSPDNNKHHLNFNVRKTCSAQTNLKQIKDFTQAIRKDKATNILDELEKTCMDTMCLENDKNVNKATLREVGDKLVTLIKSINTFIEEIKISKTTMKQNGLESNICGCKGDKILKIKDAVASTGDEKINKRTETCDCEAMFNEHLQTPKVDNTIKRMSSNSYQIEFEEPTRDCSTGLKNSFINDPPAAIDQNNREISTNSETNPIFQQITIAVNTDPLSFLALLRLSTDAVKNILSCLPILSHCQHLLSLPACRCIQSEQSRYICNVCGAGFNNPSALNEHIFEHNLGNARFFNFILL